MFKVWCTLDYNFVSIPFLKSYNSMNMYMITFYKKSRVLAFSIPVL